MRKKARKYTRKDIIAINVKKYKETHHHLVVNDHVTQVRVDHKNRFGQKIKGLKFRRNIPYNYGIKITATTAINTFFVRFPLDVVFCDRHGYVVSIFPNFKSNGITPSQKHLKAWICYEFKVGVIQREEIGIGDKLSITKVGLFDK